MVSNVGSIEGRNKHLGLPQMDDGANYAMKTDCSTTRAGPRAALPRKTYSGRCDQNRHPAQRSIHS